jgi:hypothetical protein
LALLVGKQDLTGEDRERERDRGNPLACSSTLNRLELVIPIPRPTIAIKTVRKVWLSFSEAYPYASDFAQILANIRRHPAWAPSG